MTESESLHPLPRIVLKNLFEGPLDLLLHLIKVNEMDITEVSLADVTQQYLMYLDAMKVLDLEVAGEFLVIAATLLSIKSRSLLPAQPGEEGEEEGEEVDAALSTRQLLRRLIEFRKFKELAQRLRSLEEKHRGVYYRANVVSILPPPQPEESPSQDIRSLFDAFARVLLQARTRPMHSVRREQFHVEDKLVELRERLRSERRVNLGAIFKRCICKEEIIVTFLASLELARLREITVAQAAPFEDILIEPWGDSVVYVG